MDNGEEAPTNDVVDGAGEASAEQEATTTVEETAHVGTEGDIQQQEEGTGPSGSEQVDVPAEIVETTTTGESEVQDNNQDAANLNATGESEVGVNDRGIVDGNGDGESRNQITEGGAVGTGDSNTTRLSTAGTTGQPVAAAGTSSTRISTTIPSTSKAVTATVTAVENEGGDAAAEIIEPGTETANTVNNDTAAGGGEPVLPGTARASTSATTGVRPSIAAVNGAGSGAATAATRPSVSAATRASVSVPGTTTTIPTTTDGVLQARQSVSGTIGGSRISTSIQPPGTGGGTRESVVTGGGVVVDGGVGNGDPATAASEGGISTHVFADEVQEGGDGEIVEGHGEEGQMGVPSTVSSGDDLGESRGGVEAAIEGGGGDASFGQDVGGSVSGQATAEGSVKQEQDASTNITEQPSSAEAVVISDHATITFGVDESEDLDLTTIAKEREQGEAQQATLAVEPAIDASQRPSMSTKAQAPRLSTKPLPPTELLSDLTTWHRKKYVGGYRHRTTQIEYFHAWSQTPTPMEIRDAKAAPKFHRDTQTKFLRNRVAQAKRDAFTQMNKPDLHVSSEYDYALRPRPYFSAEEYHKMIVRKKERRRKELADKKRRKEIESRLHPKTTKDFEILYNGLENWRLQETEKINVAGYSEPARLAALADLMDQEAGLIQKIDRLRISANEENREKGIIRLLEKMSSPKKWPVYKGGTVLVDTPNTIRARELRDLYHALNVRLLMVDERLQILLHVKYTVKEFDCNLTREIVELIDREGDLVSRGRDPKSLEGLRKRISNLFLHFIQTPEFNPEASLYQKFPDAGQAWKRDQAVYYCRGCTKYLPSTEFYLSTTMKHLGRCKPCTIKENIANQRKEDSCYADLLKSMRHQESQKRASLNTPEDSHYNAIALLQESDMRYLVDVIWNKQSCISGSRNMEDLVLTRWDPRMEVSPWNCILLTKAEGEKHDGQRNPMDLYSEDFTRMIHQKHLAARRHFAQLPAMERYLRRHYGEDREGRLVPRVMALAQ
ncbi:hypothetical protein HDU76_001833 [Blyttiomyces sp. JEL0837]|nr:hypothetical protein HDU76_001833 [Blyttiomyces sp. JEL0837]